MTAGRSDEGLSAGTGMTAVAAAIPLGIAEVAKGVPAAAAAADTADPDDREAVRTATPTDLATAAETTTVPLLGATSATATDHNVTAAAAETISCTVPRAFCTMLYQPASTPHLSQTIYRSSRSSFFRVHPLL